MTRGPLAWILTVALALLVMSASAQEPAPIEPAAPANLTSVAVPVQQIFDKFDHRVHEKVFGRQNLGCVACHQLGGRTSDAVGSEALDSAYLTPPPGACHFCHNPSGDRKPIGPRTCYSCHGDIPPPDSHGVDWREWHGTEARMSAKPCKLCHERSYCVDCHILRDSIRYRVHDRTFLAIHGIAALADPTECSTCHLQNDCIQCHTTNDGRLR